MERLVIETVPAQIRTVQAQIAEGDKVQAARRALLRRLLDTAVLYGVELCPAPAREAVRESSNGNAASPGGADGVPIRGAA
jgi:hypothetical protein